MPSRKLLRTGTSMIRPDGSAIRPRMAPSWPMLPLFPRAPDAVIIVTGPFGSSERIISSRHRRARLLPDADDLLVALVLGDEAALELAIDRPTTESSAALRRAGLSVGISMSNRPIVMPPRVANSKPTLLMPSTRWAVSSGPSRR